MRLIAPVLTALVVLLVGCGVGVMLTDQFLHREAAAIGLGLSVFAILLGVKAIKAGNRAGDGGMGECLFGLALFLVVAGGWIGGLVNVFR